jgi:hypothetical protein
MEETRGQSEDANETLSHATLLVGLGYVHEGLGVNLKGFEARETKPFGTRSDPIARVLPEVDSGTHPV